MLEEQLSISVALLTDIWTSLPKLFSCPEQQSYHMLNNDEYEAEDFGLKEKLMEVNFEN